MDLTTIFILGILLGACAGVTAVSCCRMAAFGDDIFEGEGE